MEEPKDILDKAIDALANTNVPPGPPQEVVDATLARLDAAGAEPAEATITLLKPTPRLKTVVDLIKFAAAAVVLIGTGYLIGRLSAPKPPDIEQLYAALKPAIQRDLLEPMSRQWQLILTSNNAELKDELRTEFRQDLNQFAVQTLVASGAATNQLIRELVESFQVAQVQQRRSVAAALRQIELDRMRDKAELAGGLETLAVLTGDELQRTKDDIAQLLVYNQPAPLNPNITNERSNQ